MLDNNKTTLLKLVNAGYKTATNFYVKKFIDLEEKQKFLDDIKTQYPNVEAYMHPINDSFLEVVNKLRFQDKLQQFYPAFNFKSMEEAILRRNELTGSLAYQVFCGRMFDIPEICISEFSFSDKNKPRNYVSGFGGQVSVYYESVQAQQAAQSWISILEQKAHEL